MDVNEVLVRLMKDFNSLPAMKLAWSCQLTIDDVSDIPKISPSHYLRELQYSSDERHALLAEQYKSLKSSNHGSKISVEPSVLSFQNYKSGDKLSTAVTVRNIDKTMQKISFTMDEGGPFLIDDSSRRVGRFASGMVTSVTIQFKPEDEGDYYHKLIIHVNGLRLAIPVLGFGRRGMLDIPDKLNFGKVPVKYVNKLLTPAFNIGKQTVRFIVSTNAPFGVVPEKGVVMSNDSISLTVSYSSNFLEKSTGFLRIKYENGEEVYVELEAEGINEDITLSPMDVEFQDTYMGMVTRAKVTIRNNSKITANFQWKTHISTLYYFEVLNPGTPTFTDINHLNEDGSGDHDIDPKKQHLYSRGDSLGINKLIEAQKHLGGLYSEKQEPLYTAESFRIEPPMGVIQPHSSKELFVLFNPTRPGMFFSEAFCDISGLEQRTEIRITGRALGPKFKFGFDMLEIGNMFLGGGHTYEIPVTNTSEVQGTVTFEDFVGLMNPQLISMKPDRITLGPGEYGAFYLYINPIGKPLPVFEELRFIVGSTSEIISIIIKGDIIYPNIRFTAEVLRFGEVSYGFPETRQVVLVNDTLVPLHISLTVEPDGVEQVLNAENIIAAIREPDYTFPTNPQEFQVDPTLFVLSGRGFQRLNVTLTAANYGDYTRKLAVRIGNDSEIIKELPVKATCVVPTLIKPSEVIQVKCVSGITCMTSFTFHNPSTLSAVYCCVPVVSDEVNMSSENFLGIIKARDSTTVQFNVVTKNKGVAESRIEVFVAGKTEPIFEVGVKCITVSAIGALMLSRNQIDMGEQKVRVKATDTFEIINSQSVPISYVITMVKGGGMKEVWEVYPVVGIAKPESEDNTITVSVTLNEIGTYEGIFLIHVIGSKVGLELKVTVVGTGCAFIFEPELDESGIIDFGYLFTNTLEMMTFEVTNPGYLVKHLQWKHPDEDAPVNPNVYDGKKNRRIELDKFLPKASKPKPRNMVFEISPMQKVLQGEETMKLDIKAFSTVAKKFESGFTLWAYAEVPKEVDKDFQKRMSKANVGLQIGRKTELSVMDKVFLPSPAQIIKIIAEFDVPKLKLSKYAIAFRIDPNPTDYSDIYLQNQAFFAENPCNAPLTVIFHTITPFGIIIGNDTIEEWKYTFAPKQTVKIVINFDISRLPKDSGVTTFTGTLDCIYEKHPTSDETILLSGVLHFSTVELEKSVVDFEEIYNGQEAVSEFIAKNSGKYCVSYKLYIVTNSVLMEIVNPTSEQDTIQELDLRYTSSDVDMFEQAKLPTERAGSISKEPVDRCAEYRESLLEDIGDIQKLQSERRECDTFKESMKFYYDKFYRMKLMSFLGLRDPDEEPKDEFTYFHYFREKIHKTSGVMAAPNEVIDVIPIADFLQSRERVSHLRIHMPISMTIKVVLVHRLVFKILGAEEEKKIGNKLGIKIMIFEYAISLEK